MKKFLLVILLIVGCDEIIDTTPDTPPSVEITYPLNYSELDTTTVIKVEAAGNGGITKVEFIISGNLVSTDAIAPYEYEWDICAEQNYEVSVLAKAEDSYGNIGQSQSMYYHFNAEYDCADVCGGSAIADCDGICNGETPMDNCGVCNGNDLYIDYYSCPDLAAVMDWGICSDINNCITSNSLTWSSGRVTKIDYNYSSGDSMPENVGNLSELKELSLDGLYLFEVPNISYITNLEKLYFVETNLIRLPDNIDTLTKLEVLFIQGIGNHKKTSLASLPDNICNLTNLTLLEFKYTDLESLPENIGDLVNLTALNITQNSLTSIPTSICNLTVSLNLDYNCLPESYNYSCLDTFGYQGNCE